MAATRLVDRLAVALLAVGVVACTQSDGEASEQTLTVQVTAERLAAEQLVGCEQPIERSGLAIGDGARLVVRDEEGEEVGAGAFELSPGAEACDWTATATVPDADRYEVLVAVDVLATVAHDELAGAGWSLTAHVDAGGGVDVSP